MICRIDRQFVLPAVLAGVMFLAGCGQDGVEVYEVAKQPPSASAPASSQGGTDPHAGMRATMPQVKWTELPEGWTQSEQSGGMRAATIQLPAPEGEQGELAIIPMSGMAGKELQLVNMWRQQVSLQPLEETDLETASVEVQVGDTKGDLFEMAGLAPIGEEGLQGRILVAIVEHGGQDWFFKVTGHDEVVAGQKDAFLKFLKGISWEMGPAPVGMAAASLPDGHPPIGASTMGAPAASPDAATDAHGDRWVAPEHWQQLPGGQFLFAKFRAAGDGEATADINVSTSPGTGGGFLPNVNRWRRQLGLPPVDEGALAGMVQSIDTPAGTVKVVEMSGTDARTGAMAATNGSSGEETSLVAAVLMLSDSAWFYKLMGDKDVVAAEKEAFLNFVRSVRYSE